MEKAPNNSFENKNSDEKPLTAEERPILKEAELVNVLGLNENSKWYKDYEDLYYEKDRKRTAVPIALMQFVYANKYDSKTSQSYSRLMSRGGFAAPELFGEYSSAEEVRDFYRELRGIQDAGQLSDDLEEISKDFKTLFRIYLYSPDSSLGPLERFVSELRKSGVSNEDIYTILLKKSIQTLNEMTLIQPELRENLMKKLGPVVNLAK